MYLYNKKIFFIDHTSPLFVFYFTKIMAIALNIVILLPYLSHKYTGKLCDPYRLSPCIIHTFPPQIWAVKGAVYYIQKKIDTFVMLLFSSRNDTKHTKISIRQMTQHMQNVT